jgi:hypothetical protein
MPIRLMERQRLTDMSAVRVLSLVAGQRPRWCIAVAASVICLAALGLAGCGTATVQPTAGTPSQPRPSLTALPGSIHAPPGFSRSGCPVTTVQPGSLCFTRPTSVILARSSFARLVQTAGVTVTTSQASCRPRTPAKRPRALYILSCHAQGSSNQTDVFVNALSLVTATGRSFLPTTRSLPMHLRGAKHGAPIIIEFLNFGRAGGTS